MIRLSLTNNTNLAIKAINKASKSTLNLIANEVMPEINRNTPVDTGLLKSNNKYKILGLPFFKRTLIFYNNTEYAIFVHEGTRKMRARRFIYDSIIKKRQKIIQIAVSRYRSWFS